MNRKRTLTAVACGLIVSLIAIPAWGGWWTRNDSIKGKGTPEKETREIDAVTRVELSTIGTLYIELGDKPELLVEAQGNLLEFIETKQRRDYLEIRSRRGINLRPTKSIEYHLTVTALEEIMVSSSGDVVVSDVKADRLTIEVSSSGDVEVAEIDSPRLDIYISSSGDVLIDSWQGTVLDVDLSSSGDLEIGGGAADELRIDISSSGDCMTRKLDSRIAKVRTSSSGDAVIRVSEHLHARSSSSGDIVYYGRPEVDSRSSSSGDIYRGGS